MTAPKFHTYLTIRGMAVHDGIDCGGGDTEGWDARSWDEFRDKVIAALAGVDVHVEFRENVQATGVWHQQETDDEPAWA